MSKLISWNIGGRIKVRSEQLAWIESEQADVLALQEVARASDLKQSLSERGFKHFECTNPTAGRKKLVAIASHKPLKRIRPFAVRHHPERVISCLISLGRKQAELHCVHVPHGEKFGRIKVEFLEAVTRGACNSQAASIARGRL